MTAILLALLAIQLGCPAGDAPDPPVPTVDSATPSDSGAGDTGTDTDPDWQSLPDDCTPPATAWTDPFQLTGSAWNGQDNPGEWFVELLDVVIQPDEGRVLAAGQGGMIVFEWVEGGDPITRGHVGSPSGGPSGRYFHVLPGPDGLAWATHRDIGLEVITLADLDDPSVLTTLSAVGWEGLDQGGDHLYVANTLGTVEVFDVSDPRDPEQGTSIAGLGRPWDVWVDGAVAYVADGALGLVALDLGDPAVPVVAGQAATEGIPLRLLGDGAGTVYMASGAAGVEIYDVTDPLAPVRVGAVDVGGGVLDLALDGGRLGAVTQEAVVLLDVADAGTPHLPVPFSYQETEQYAMTIDAHDGAWVVGDWNILEVWQAQDSPAPAIDLSLDTVAFLDAAESRELTVVNRGGASLTLSGLGVVAGVTAQIDATVLAPGERATILVSWDGSTALEDASLCVVSDDPGRPAVSVTLTSGQEGEGKAVGQQAPDFTLLDLDGNTHRLSEQRGHPVVLAYFATW